MFSNKKGIGIKKFIYIPCDGGGCGSASLDRDTLLEILSTPM